jgi:hypothetical protein
LGDIIGVGVTPELDTINSFFICNRPGDQTEPKVIFNGKNYVVVWIDAAYNGPTVVRVTPQWLVLDSGNFIGEGNDNPDIACDGNGCFVVWSKDYYGVCGRFIDSLAQPVGEVITIDTTRATGTMPVVEFGSDKYLVAWPDFSEGGASLDIFGQLVSSDGNLFGDKITIVDGIQTQDYVNIVFDGYYYLVAWIEDSDSVFGRFVTSDGQLLGSVFHISDDLSYNRQHTAVSYGIANYFVVWDEYHDGTDIYGNMDITGGIEEEENEIVRSIHSTIFGTFSFSGLKDFKIYDISGRLVKLNQLKPGVYFIETDEQIIRKVVKIK